jgi:hypothetical protein
VSERGRTAILALLLGVVATLPYLASLRGDFVFDDLSAIKNNQVVQAPLDPEALLTTGFWGDTIGLRAGTYRPLTVLTFWLDWRVGAGAPWAFHASNLVLYALCVATVFVALRSRFRERGLALLATGLFALHAVHSENVASIVGRADVIALPLAVAAWALARSPRVVPAVASGLLLLLGLLAKETAIAVLPLVWLEDLFKLDPGRAPRPRVRRFALGSCTLATLAYLGLRLQALGGMGPPVGMLGNPLVNAGLASRVYTMLALLARAIGLLLWPARLSADYSAAEIEPSRALGEPRVLLGLALLALGVGLFVALRRRRPAAAWGLLLFGLGYAPASNAWIIPIIFAERLLFVASLGLCVFAAALVVTLPQARLRGAAACAAVVLALASGARAAVRTSDWRTQRALFAVNVRTAPRNARGWYNLGTEELNDRNLEGAEQCFARVVDLTPQWALAHNLHAIALDQMGRTDEAGSEFERAIATDPSCLQCVQNTIRYYLNHHRDAEARTLLARYRNSEPPTPTRHAGSD